VTDDPQQLQPTIRNAVIHLINEQPLLADLFGPPAGTDQGLLCTNLRTMSGTRPTFADHIESIFFFPYQYIRFVEIHPPKDRPAAGDVPGSTAGAADEPEAELEIDEDFLRRIRDV